MSRPAPLSGFPEWLPEGRIVEQRLIDALRRTFELHGFAPVETRAVEPLSELLRKGETSKEVYVLRRLQELQASGSAPAEPDDRTLGLHFDLTVPFARYVLENAGHLEFPFKRYQIQKVWRGERPQQGRFREFLQADIDVVGLGELPQHYEVELPLVMLEALNSLPIGRVLVLVNNRKLAEGFYRGLGLRAGPAGEDPVPAVFRTLDKLAKVGPRTTGNLLHEQVGLSAAQVTACLDLARIRGTDPDQVIAQVTTLADRHAARHPLLDEGLAELGTLLRATAEARPGQVRADLSIARGLDYYTGSVYETILVGHADLGSICSGGRYDSLASQAGQTYPGVGLSVGVSRLVSLLLGQGLVRATRGTPTAVLVAVVDEASRAHSVGIATKLRRRGIPTDVAPEAAKFGKQIRYADRRGIPYVWFPGVDGAFDQVKDIRSGEQTQAVASTWNPPFEDLWPRIETPEPPTVADSVDTSIRLPDL